MSKIDELLPMRSDRQFLLPLVFVTAGVNVVNSSISVMLVKVGIILIKHMSSAGL